jgi:zinc protease
MIEKKGKSIIFSLFFFILTLQFLFFPYSSAEALDVKKKTLPNGLKVIHVERPYLPIVVMNLAIMASPLNEPEEKAGLAHLTSTMLTEGTSKRSSTAISEEIEFLGASLAASAGSDYTTLSLSILKKDLEKGFEIFSDVLINPIFPEEELKRKKELLKGSLRQTEEDPSFLASRAFIKEVFGSHPYGRLITGTIETIDKIERDDLVNFYKKYYLPENAFLVVAGDITSGELDRLFDKYLKDWKKETGQNIKGDKVFEIPEKKKKTILINKDITQANILFGHLGVSRDNPDYYAIAVMNYILGGGGLTSRLMKTIRDEMGLTYSIFSSFNSNKLTGQFEVEVQTKNESAGVVVKEIINQIKKIKTGPVSDQELEDAKAFLTGSFPRRLETTRRIVDFLSAVEFYNLGDDYIQKYPEYIRSVTKEDILRVANKYLDTENYILVIVGNEKKINLSDF